SMKRPLMTSMNKVEPSVALTTPITFCVWSVVAVRIEAPTRTDVHGGGVDVGQSLRPMKATSRASPGGRRGSAGCRGGGGSNPGAGADDKANGTAVVALLKITIRPAPQFRMPWSTQSAPGTDPTTGGQMPTA